MLLAKSTLDAGVSEVKITLVMLTLCLQLSKERNVGPGWRILVHADDGRPESMVAPPAVVGFPPTLLCLAMDAVE